MNVWWHGGKGLLGGLGDVSGDVYCPYGPMGQSPSWRRCFPVSGLSFSQAAAVESPRPCGAAVAGT